MAEEVDHGPRITRVENEVTDIKQQVTRLEGKMTSFGDILSRIESGIKDAQTRQDEEKQASRINPVALATVLISIISVLIGGAWLVSGELARQDERSVEQQRLIDKIELRQWQQRAGGAPSGQEEVRT